MCLCPENNLSEAERVFLEAIELPKARRSEFVKDNCSGKPDLERLVLSILDIESNSHPILDNAPAAAASIAFDAAEIPANAVTDLSAEAFLEFERQMLDAIVNDGSRGSPRLEQLKSVWQKQFVDRPFLEPSSRVEFFRSVGKAAKQIALQHAAKFDSCPFGVQQKSSDLHFRFQRPKTSELAKAVDTLAKEWPEHAMTFNLRYFAGLTRDEIAMAIGITVDNVRQQWLFAKAWLLDFFNRA